MRANSTFLLAKCAHELARIVDREGAALSARSRVHLTRMGKLLLRAAGEGEAGAALDAATATDLSVLLKEGGVKTAEKLAIEQAFAAIGDMIAARESDAIPDDLTAQAVALALRYRDRFDEVIGALANREGHRERTADEQRQPIAVARLNDYLARRGAAGRIAGLSPLWTESSKEISLIETDEGGGWPKRAVLRRERPYAIVANSVADEYDVLRAVFDAGLPVPRPLFAEHDASIFEGRVIATAFAPGAIHTVEQLGEAARPVVAAAAAFLAGLHRVPPSAVPRIAAEGVAGGQRGHLRRRIAACQQTWQRVRLEPEPAMEAALAWLAANVDRLDDDAVIVHGDYDLRNMLVEEGQLATVLDWEFAKLGHRAEDLGYFHDRVIEVMPWSEFMGHYEAAGGAPIDGVSVHYHRILAWTLRTTVAATAYSGYWRGQHDDFRLGTCAFYEYPDHVRRLSRALLELG